MSLILLINLLFFLLENIKTSKTSKTSHLSIPFRIQNYNKDKSINSKLIDNYLYKDIIIQFSVGNPPQDVQLSACLGEYTTFIVANNANGFEGGTYNKSLSNSYLSLFEPQFYTFQTFSEGICSKENFIINNLTINNLTFILATEIGRNNCCSSYCEVVMQPGILGFQVDQPANQVQEYVNNTNFISQLTEKGIISNYSFYFHFDSNNYNSGKIIIGFNPDENDSDNFTNKEFLFTRLSEDYIDWSLKFDKIYYGEKEFNGKSFLLRIEFGLIRGYSEWEDIIIKEFFDNLIQEKKCFKDYTNEFGNTTYFYYCDKTVNLSTFKPFLFRINDFEYDFILTKEDLFVETEEKYYLFLMIFGGISDLILGYPFLKKYQLIFNQDTKTIGFYKEPREPSIITYYIIIFILGTILIILIIIGIIIYFKRIKHTKNLTKELSYDEEYSNYIITEGEN